eukprot:1180533-Prorocentrum_minimum.AAC.1
MTNQGQKPRFKCKRGRTLRGVPGPTGCPRARSRSAPAAPRCPAGRTSCTPGAHRLRHVSGSHPETGGTMAPLVLPVVRRYGFKAKEGEFRPKAVRAYLRPRGHLLHHFHLGPVGVVGGDSAEGAPGGPARAGRGAAVHELDVNASCLTSVTSACRKWLKRSARGTRPSPWRSSTEKARLVTTERAAKYSSKVKRSARQSAGWATQAGATKSAHSRLAASHMSWTTFPDTTTRSQPPACPVSPSHPSHSSPRSLRSPFSPLPHQHVLNRVIETNTHLE